MKVKFTKHHKDAVTPAYAKKGDNGLDLTAVSVDYKEKFISYDTGISVEIPEGYVGLAFTRSSVTNQPVGFYLRNSVGVIDSSYRGTISFRYNYPEGENIGNIYQVGDKVGQLVIVPAPIIELEEVTELSETSRGTGSYGHTGN